MRSPSAHVRSRRDAALLSPRTILVTLARLLLVVSVSLVAATLPALAYASPPDPSWIPGAYDGDDWDDAVVLVASGTGNVAPTVHADPPSLAPLTGALPQPTTEATSVLSASAVRPRAP